MKFVGVILLLMVHPAMAGGIYSYVDSEGVQVWTNVGATRSSGGQSESREDTPLSDGFFTPLIQDYSSQYGLDEDLVEAIIKVESNFDPLAVSPKNCKGLMQLHPDTARRFGVTDIFDPADNIEGGVKYLSYLMSSFGQDLDHVLAAYNAGENAVKRYNGIPPYSETINYVRKVKSLFQPDGPPEGSTREVSRKIRVVRKVDEDGLILFTNTE